MQKIFRRQRSLWFLGLGLTVVTAGALIGGPALSQQPAPRPNADGNTSVVPAVAGEAQQEAGPSLLLVSNEHDAVTSEAAAPPRPLATARATGETSTQPTPAAPPYSASVGLQTASVSVDWVTPESILIGQEGLFELVLRNRGRVAVERITVEDVVPAGFRLLTAQPEPVKAAAGQAPSWYFQRLGPQEEARIALRLVPEKIGNVQSNARVNFGTSSATSFRVVEPKLQLDVEAPESVLVGNQAVFHLTVRNPGSGKATNAVLKVELPEELAMVAENSTYSLGVLNPGESRSIRVIARVNGLGMHACRFVATADSGLRDEAARKLAGVGAQLELSIEGPKFRYISRPARYTLRVRNTGSAPAHNVSLVGRVPKAFAYVEADNSGQFDSINKSINWFVGTLEVGQEFESVFALRAEAQGEFPVQAEAIGERGLHVEARRMTRIEGIAAILLEVVDSEDPIEVGADTFYEILVTNQGTDFANNLQIIANIPEEMEIIDTRGPTNAKIDGQTVRFETLSKLAPRADAIYRVKVRGLKPGDSRVEVRAQADGFESPIVELESTRVYEDQ